MTIITDAPKQLKLISRGDMMREIRRYLSYNFVLIPTLPGTSAMPAVKWQQQPLQRITATNNAEMKWYADRIKKRYNLAVVCEPSNIVALDIDTKSKVYGD